jgi:hypothetical protein
VDEEPGITLRWPHSAHRRYSVEFSDGFLNWTKVEVVTPRFPAPGVAEWTDSTAASNNRFYRIRVE